MDRAMMNWRTRIFMVRFAQVNGAVREKKSLFLSYYEKHLQYSGPGWVPWVSGKIYYVPQEWLSRRLYDGRWLVI